MRLPFPRRGHPIPAVGASIARPVCEANNRMRQQTIQPGALYCTACGVATRLDLPPANCVRTERRSDVGIAPYGRRGARTAGCRPYGGWGRAMLAPTAALRTGYPVPDVGAHSVRPKALRWRVMMAGRLPALRWPADRRRCNGGERRVGAGVFDSPNVSKQERFGASGRRPLRWTCRQIAGATMAG